MALEGLKAELEEVKGVSAAQLAWLTKPRASWQHEAGVAEVVEPMAAWIVASGGAEPVLVRAPGADCIARRGSWSGDAIGNEAIGNGAIGTIGGGRRAGGGSVAPTLLASLPSLPPPAPAVAGTIIGVRGGVEGGGVVPSAPVPSAPVTIEEPVRLATVGKTPREPPLPPLEPPPPPPLDPPPTPFSPSCLAAARRSTARRREVCNSTRPNVGLALPSASTRTPTRSLSASREVTATISSRLPLRGTWEAIVFSSHFFIQSSFRMEGHIAIAHD